MLSGHKDEYLAVAWWLSTMLPVVSCCSTQKWLVGCGWLCWRLVISSLTYSIMKGCVELVLIAQLYLLKN